MYSDDQMGVIQVSGLSRMGVEWVSEGVWKGAAPYEVHSTHVHAGEPHCHSCTTSHSKGEGNSELRVQVGVQVRMRGGVA